MLDKSDYIKIVGIVLITVAILSVIVYTFDCYVLAPRAIDEAYETAKHELEIWWSREGIAMGVDRDQYYQMQNDLADSYGKPHPYQPTPEPTLSGFLGTNGVKVTDFTYNRDLTKDGEGVINGSITITYTGEQDIANLTLSIDNGIAHYFNVLAKGWQQTFQVSYKIDIDPGVNPIYVPDTTINMQVNGQRLGGILLSWYGAETHTELDDSFPSSIFKLSVITALAYNNTYVVIVDVEGYSTWATSQSPWHLDFTVGNYTIPLNSQENIHPIVYACNIVRTEDANLLVLHGDGKDVTLPLYFDAETREYTVKL